MIKKILIVDDEADVLEVLGARLSSIGYQVVKAGNGREAIDKARIEMPNLIILDILLPDIDGEDVAQALRNMPLTKDIPIIYLTCLFTKQDEKREGHQINKNLFVAKPYDIKELLDLISKTIR